jgi:hypothetical protein
MIFIMLREILRRWDKVLQDGGLGPIHIKNTGPTVVQYPFDTNYCTYVELEAWIHWSWPYLLRFHVDRDNPSRLVVVTGHSGNHLIKLWEDGSLLELETIIEFTLGCEVMRVTPWYKWLRRKTRRWFKEFFGPRGDYYYTHSGW